MCKNVIHAAPRILVGLLFLVAGIMKLTIMTPEAFSGMIEANFAMVGLTGSLALIAAWLVTLGEIVGGAIVLAGKMVPTKIYKIAIRVLIFITTAAVIFVQWGDVNSVFKDLIIIAVLFQICHSKAVCPIGLTGDKKHHN